MKNLIGNIIAGTIVILVGIHILNWEIKGFGWRGSYFDKFKQCMLIPWSLI
jgi:hypothetical protein